MRTLKIQDVGDFYKGNVIPAIRLRGKWLTAAGLNAGSEVEISNPEKGKLIIQIKERKENYDQEENN
jgi:antitoxin component of MazEF toxin-antitoxin module